MRKLSISSSLATFLFSALAILSGALLLSIANSVSPSNASQQVLWAFFLSLTFSCTAVIALVLHVVRNLFKKKSSIKVGFWISVRQAFLLSCMITLSLFLNALHLFHLWDALPLLFAFILIEFFFQAEKRPHASLSHES